MQVADNKQEVLRKSSEVIEEYLMVMRREINPSKEYERLTRFVLNKIDVMTATQTDIIKFLESEVKVFNILVSSMYTMSDMNNKWDIPSSMSELESLGLETPKLNELNDSYEVENLVVNLKQAFYIQD